MDLSVHGMFITMHSHRASEVCVDKGVGDEERETERERCVCAGEGGGQISSLTFELGRLAAVHEDLIPRPLVRTCVCVCSLCSLAMSKFTSVSPQVHTWDARKVTHFHSFSLPLPAPCIPFLHQRVQKHSLQRSYQRKYPENQPLV